MLTDAHEIIAFIKNAEKKTPVKLYINGSLGDIKDKRIQQFGTSTSKIIIGPVEVVDEILTEYAAVITDYYLECDRRNSAIPLLDTSHLNARVEPGAIIRDLVVIEDYAVVMMGAVINIGAYIGKGAMIDMNAVIGGRGIIGANSHIGAGAVVAGVIEPPSSQPVRIGEHVLVGAGAVILEGIQIGDHAVIGAGSIVTKDVPPYAVVMGNPARIVKQKDETLAEKTEIVADLRNLNE